MEAKKFDWLDVRSAIVLLKDADAMSTEAALNAAYDAGFKSGIAAEKKDAFQRIGVIGPGGGSGGGR